MNNFNFFTKNAKNARQNATFEFRQKNRCTRRRKVYYRKNFFPHEIDINSHFCLKNPSYRRLLKDQERRSRHVNFFWKPGLRPPGAHKFSYFLAKWSNLNISFENLKNLLETDTNTFEIASRETSFLFITAVIY